MGKPASLPPGKRIFTSILLAIILIGSTISSALLIGLSVIPQQAWAAPPGTAPAQTAPSNGATTTDQTPTFDWNSVSATPSVTTYHLLVDNNNDFLSPEINVNVAAPTTQHTPSSNLALGTYNWKVSAINADGEGPFSSVRTVTLVDLSAPILASPADGSATNDLTPTFDFDRIDPEPSGLLYQIQADNSGNTFPSPEVDNIQSSSDSSSFTPGSNLAVGTYSWRVGAKSDAADPPSWSTVWTVTLDSGTAPAAPSLITPISGFTNDQTPLFDWNDATDPSGINRYTIQVSTSSSLSGGAGSSFSSTVISTNIDGSPPASQFTPGTNLAAGTYFWHVRARDAASNTGLYGATSSFTIDITAPTLAPTLSAPANAATINDNTPTFDWSAVSDPSTPVTYELLVDNENTFSMPLSISEPSLSSPTFTAGSALTDGTYFWKVRAKDGAGNVGAFSSVFTFTIDSTGPTVTASPPGGTFGAAGTSVELSSTDPDLDAIYYTTNGDTPTSASTLYTAAIPITVTTTLKAIGYDTFDNPGTVLTEEYTITTSTTIDTSMSLKLEGNKKITAGSTYTASGKLIDAVADSPIAGKTISVTTDGSSPVTGTTDSKGKFTVQLTAPSTLGKHDIQAHFAGDSQYNPSDSPVKKLTVEGTSAALATATTSIDTSLSLKLEGKDKVTAGATFSASGKLIDSVSKKPLSGKSISVTTDGGSPKASDSTDGKGEFEVSLKAPDSYGKHDIQAHFAGDSQYNPSDSPVSKITIEGSTTTLKNEKTTVTTDEQPTDEQPTDEEPTDEEPTDEEPTDEEPTDEEPTDEEPTDEEPTDEEPTN